MLSRKVQKPCRFHLQLQVKPPSLQAARPFPSRHGLPQSSAALHKARQADPGQSDQSFILNSGEFKRSDSNSKAPFRGVDRKNKFIISFNIDISIHAERILRRDAKQMQELQRNL